MICEKCGIREANIRYAQIINGVKTEHNICSQCAKEMDFGQYAALMDVENPLGRLLSSLLGLGDVREEADVRCNVVCPTCSTSFNDFVKNSRFGCADCYAVFDLFIKDKIKQIQGSETHKGKRPKILKQSAVSQAPLFDDTVSADLQSAQDSEDKEAQARRLAQLKLSLKEALKTEEYEEAARLRDEIRGLEGQGREDAKS